MPFVGIYVIVSKSLTADYPGAVRTTFFIVSPRLVNHVTHNTLVIIIFKHRDLGRFQDLEMVLEDVNKSEKVMFVSRKNCICYCEGQFWPQDSFDILQKELLLYAQSISPKSFSFFGLLPKFVGNSVTEAPKIPPFELSCLSVLFAVALGNCSSFKFSFLCAKVHY